MEIFYRELFLLLCFRKNPEHFRSADLTGAGHRLPFTTAFSGEAHLLGILHYAVFCLTLNAICCISHIKLLFSDNPYYTTGTPTKLAESENTLIRDRPRIPRPALRGEDWRASGDMMSAEPTPCLTKTP